MTRMRPSPGRRIFALGLLALFAAVPCRAEDFLYSDSEADCAARLIYRNECSSKEENLLYWSPNEPFPSLGIGHFIWYPEEARGPYLETFPAYLDFAEERGRVLPEWIANLPDRHSPWKSREEFQKDLLSDRARELRDFLSKTQREQALFILRRFGRVFPRILDDLDEADREAVQKKYDLLMENRRATFAMVDYVNFKGEGLRADARYGGIGWGLAQVLKEMKMPDDPGRALEEFIESAERVLERRVRQSPKPEVESKWLKGWKNRVRGYAQIDC